MSICKQAKKAFFLESFVTFLILSQTYHGVTSYVHNIGHLNNARVELVIDVIKLDIQLSDVVAGITNSDVDCFSAVGHRQTHISQTGHFEISERKQILDLKLFLQQTSILPNNGNMISRQAINQS